MDGSTALKIGDCTGRTLDETMHDIATAICRRDAERRARFKEPLPVDPTPQQQYLQGLCQLFAMWAVGTLAVKVRQSDILLRPARYTLTQTLAEPRKPEGNLGPDVVIAHTAITLTRDGNAQELMIALHADGVVRARDDGQRRGRNTQYMEAQVQALDGTAADRFVFDFVRSAVNLS